jgi:hypothetical protein
MEKLEEPGNKVATRYGDQAAWEISLAICVTMGNTKSATA